MPPHQFARGNNFRNSIQRKTYLQQLSTSLIQEDKPNSVFLNEAHSSSDCLSAQKMGLSDKQKMLRKRGFSFSYLKPGHVTKKCEAKSWCVFCGKGYVILICKYLKLKCSTSQTSDDDHDYAIKSMMNNARFFLHTLKTKL